MSYNAEIPDIIHQTFLLLNQVQIYKKSLQNVVFIIPQLVVPWYGLKLVKKQ
jgi:hypothetical protein